MKKSFSLLILIALLCFSSCIASLHPLYTKDTEVFESSLLGLWKDSTQSFLFERIGNEKHYKLTYENREDGPSEVEAHLVKLGPHYYLDFKRWTSYSAMFDFNALAPSVDAHNFARVVWDQKQLQVVFFDGERIEALLKQRRARIKHESLEDNQFVLTAQPKELQEFVLKYADELLDFPESLVVKKVMN